MKNLESTHEDTNIHKDIVHNHFIFKGEKLYSKYTGGPLIPTDMLIKINFENVCE